MKCVQARGAVAEIRVRPTLMTEVKSQRSDARHQEMEKEGTEGGAYFLVSWVF
jgi:hypothetical protein